MSGSETQQLADDVLQQKTSGVKNGEQGLVVPNLAKTLFFCTLLNYIYIDFGSKFYL